MTPQPITLQQVLGLHEDLLLLYGGLPGVRDMGLLESALAQPLLEVFGQQLYPDPVVQAAAYLYYLARNHPFLDGNKRTALTVALFWLQVNGVRLRLTQDERFEMTLRVAAGELNLEALTALLRGSEPSH